MEFEEIDYLTKSIIDCAESSEKLEVVQILKNIVPEFKSNNSVFEALDK